MMRVSFYEHPSREDFEMELPQPLPSVFDVPEPQRPMAAARADDSRPIRIRCRRFRLEYVTGKPRYWWEGPVDR